METVKYMIDFHPYHDGKNPQYNSESRTLFFLKVGWEIKIPKEIPGKIREVDLIDKNIFEKRIADWVNDLLRAENDQETLVAFAPGHKAHTETDYKPNWVGNVLSNYGCANLMLKSELLTRTESVPKSATTNTRNKDEHKRTISVDGDVKDKKVFIFDDIWTTGATLEACAELILEAGARSVVPAVVGKTL